MTTPLHRRLLDQALRHAPSRGGWLHLPDLPRDYRGPTDVPYEPFDAKRDTPILSLLDQAASRWPDRVAFADPDRALGFAALADAVARLAARLRAVPARGPAGVLLPPGVGAGVALFACLAAGRVALMLDATQAPARNADLAGRGGAVLLLGPAAALGGVEGQRPVVPIEAGFEAAGPPPRGEGLGLDEPAFVVCTSGSTGEPKMLAYSQRGVLQQVAMQVDGNHLSERDRFLLPTALATISGLCSLFLMLSGCTVDIVQLSAFGIADLRRRMRDAPPSVLRAGPSLLRTLVQLPDARAVFAPLRAVRLSGEPVLRADLEPLWPLLPPGCLVWNRYGSTEMIGTSWVALPGDDHGTPRIPAGLSDPEVEMRIVDAAGLPCRPGEPGELWLRGRYGALGDWGPDGLMPGRLEPDPEDPSLRIHRTGDMARLLPDGVLEVLGRADRMVKINGHRVELAEVETALRRHAEVREAAVIARATEARVALHAFVVAAADAAPGLETRLRHAMREALPRYMQPARIALLDALPRLQGGKLDERALLARDARG
ncbi:AMP-binding protein [Falsiroseomonas sp. HW251]|uniref:AMP-binding protein n=1 Tax=Falsiroseomonas sp. HW251 TaxID=3390998 RepID=UPI003D320267